ncbi:PREDICTED: protein TIFY 10A-like [Populus euphratica]|uniref:Protein TIFY n=1 Tax=Populus euphratica TaxID=75702 RepID=A0AAJ6VHM1_POPEU|nr:PREDICTED: protein TIFY 10A-like [Populus euphratica]
MANLAQNSCNSPDQISSFAKKCNLLSRYLKEKGSFGDISLGINGKAPEVKGTGTSSSPATTLNLLTNMENSSEHITSRQKPVASSNMMRSMDFFPHFVGFSPSNYTEDAINKADNHLRKSSTMDPGTAPMTIFYAGKLTVFSDIPAAKAKEIMALATKGSSISPNGFPSDPSIIKVNSANSVAALDSNNAQQRLHLQPEAPNGSGVPHATRASLHRFFSKRKERVAARAPYQIHHPTQDLPSSSRPEEGSNPLLALDAGQSSKQLDLKL